MRKLELEEIKQLQLNILDVFDAFCREHGLRYQLAYGTLIGAVRHKGYIPWDDDIDLVMPIEDYKRMTEIVNARNDNGMMDERYRLADMFVESTVPYHQSFDLRHEDHRERIGSAQGCGFQRSRVHGHLPRCGHA